MPIDNLVYRNYLRFSGQILIFCMHLFTFFGDKVKLTFWYVQNQVPFRLCNKVSQAFRQYLPKISKYFNKNDRHRVLLALLKYHAPVVLVKPNLYIIKCAQHAKWNKNAVTSKNWKIHFCNNAFD